MVHNEVSLNEFANLIQAVGSNVTVVGAGEPGVGKSSMLKLIAERMPTHEPRYIDAALLDLGDLQMPKVDEMVSFVPNSTFVSESGKPLIVMVDELGKAMRPVQNALLTLLLEKRIGTHKLPEGSIVFGTTNLATDGVGDKIEAHARNRVCFVTVKKPDADQWLNWAMDNDVSAEVCAWVKQYPHALASYTDESQQDNAYIFNPRKSQTAFVTPRSLEKASHIIKTREVVGDNVVAAALSGCVGASAALDLVAYMHVADKLTAWEIIVEKPDTAPVSKDQIANMIMAYGAVTRVTKETIDPFMKYLDRLPSEIQIMFLSSLIKSSKAGWAVLNKSVTTACRKLEVFL